MLYKEERPVMLSDKTINLRSFVAAYLVRSGAVFEEAGYELVEALLDGELSPIFEDHLLLAFDSEVARENPSAILVTYGSTFLDEVARLAADYGRYTILYGPDTGSKPGGRLEREIHNRVEFVRCRPPKVVHQWLEEHSFRGFYFRAVFRSYERTEDLVAVVVDSHTGLVAPDFASWWNGVVATGERQVDLPRAKSLDWPELYQTARQDAERQARERAAAFQAQTARRLAGEVAKVTGYYTGLASEIARKLAATDDEVKRGRLQKQLEAVQADHQRREKDTLERYAEEVDLYLDHLVEYRLPRLHVRLELQHRDQTLNTTLLYNPFAHRLETPVCPLCGQMTTRLLPDGRNGFFCPAHTE
ncbi:MAG: hypothetical protein ABSA82_11485, partial [Thermacetogeniaceae bacterium]